jgi:hypothetical protein
MSYYTFQLPQNKKPEFPPAWFFHLQFLKPALFLTMAGDQVAPPFFAFKEEARGRS